MITLCMDSAYKNLVLGLYEDGRLLDGVAFEAFKNKVRRFLSNWKSF